MSADSAFAKWWYLIKSLHQDSIWKCIYACILLLLPMSLNITMYYYNYFHILKYYMSINCSVEWTLLAKSTRLPRYHAPHQDLHLNWPVWSSRAYQALRHELYLDMSLTKLLFPAYAMSYGVSCLVHCQGTITGILGHLENQYQVDGKWMMANRQDGDSAGREYIKSIWKCVKGDFIYHLLSRHFHCVSTFSHV